MRAVSSVRGLGYLARRRWARRLSALLRKPWIAVLVMLGAAAGVAAQLWLVRSTRAEQGTMPFAEFVPWAVLLVLVAVALLGTLRSPVKVDVADVAWVVPTPFGPPLLLGRFLIVVPVVLGVVVAAGGTAARLLAGVPIRSAWMLVIVVAGAMMVVRVVAFGAHIAAARAPRTVRVIILAAGVCSLGLAALTGDSKWAGGSVTSSWWAVLGGDADVGTAWLLVPFLVVAVSGGILLLVAPRWVEAASERARQNAEQQESLRHDATGLETGTNWFRSGLGSLRAPSWLPPEGALLFRGIAQQRRMMTPYLLELAIELAITIVLLILAPQLAWLPVAFVLAIAVTTSSFNGIAAELDHFHAWTAPLRPTLAVAAATAAPVAALVVSTQVLWVAFAFGGMSPGGWAAGAAGLAVAVPAAFGMGIVALAVGGRTVLRIPLSMLFSAVAATPVLLGILLSWQRSVVLVIAVVTIAAVIVAVVRSARSFWPAGDLAVT